MLRLRGKTYHIQYRGLDGKKTCLSLRTGDRTKAERLHRAFMAQLRARKTAALLAVKFPEALNPSPPPPTPDAPPVHRRGGIALRDMFDYAITRRPLSKDHASAWKHFCNHIPARFADQVTPQLAQSYLDEYFGGKKAKTYNNHRTCLNTVFRLCLVRAGLSVSPFASIVNRALIDVQSHRNLTQAEIERIMQAGDVQIRTMTTLALYTGQRLETCARITWKHVDSPERVFTIIPGKTSRFGKRVVVPVFPELTDFLRTIRPENVDPARPIIETVSDWYNCDAFSHKFGKLLDRLGIRDPRACFHSLRGNFITALKDRGTAPDTRRSITGHSSLEIEDIYAESVRQVSALAGSRVNSSEKSGCQNGCQS